MATNEVKVRLIAEDKISKTLQSIAHSLKNIEAVATGTAIRIDSSMAKATNSTRRMKDEVSRLRDEANRTNASISNLNSSLNNLFKGYVGFKGLEFIGDKVDDTISTVNKLNYVNYQTQAKTGVSPDELYDASTGKFTENVTSMTQEQMDKIYSASQKVRGSYSNMLKDVSKLTVLAGDAFDNNVDNAIRFQQVMAEAYAIGGASAQEMHSSMYQMVQALGSGVLQGDELRSVREGAPLAFKAIEKFAQGVYNTDESLKDMASQGKITSDIVVKAIMSASGEMDEAFAMTSVTFGQSMDIITSYATKSFESVAIKIGELLSTQYWKQFISEVQSAIGLLANAINKTLNLMIAVDKMFPSLVKDIITFTKYLTIALGTLAVYYASINMLSSYVNFKLWIKNLWGVNPQLLIIVGSILALGVAMSLFGEQINFVIDKFKNFMQVASGLDYISTILLGLTILMLGLGIAGFFASGGILASLSPILLIAGAIIFAITVLLNVVANFGNKILGGVSVVIATILNLVRGLILGIIELLFTLFTPIIAVIDFFVTAFNGGFDNISNAFYSLIGDMLNGFYNLFKVGSRVIDALFGTNWSDSIGELQKDISNRFRKEPNTSIRTQLTESLNKQVETSFLGRTNLDDAFKQGEAFGEKVSNGINSGTDWMKGKISGVVGKLSFASNIPNEIALDTTQGNIDDLLGNIDDNTKKTADNTSLSEDDVKYLRDLAEMEWKKEFTTASIQIDMNNVNNISSEMDLDGIVTYLTDTLYEQAEQFTDGVYI